MKRKIIAVGICAALMVGFGGCNGAENDTAPAAAETAGDTVTFAETASGTETSETAEAEKNTEGLTVSPSGYLLDPEVTLGDENGWDFPEKQPCLIGEPVEGVRFYGVNAGEEKSYVYDQPPFGKYEYDQYIIIEHYGTADEFAGVWTERFGSPMSVSAADIDGDGETEVVTERYSIGGTICAVNELAVYKPADGHYRRFVFDRQAFNDEYINVDIDSERKSLTLSINGFDKMFFYDFSEVVPPEMTEFKVNMLQVNNFDFDGSDITYTVTPLLTSYSYETFADINFKLKFSDGVFTCSDAEFIKDEPYRPAEQEYAVDFDTAVSNIIAAGVEADSSEFVLSGTENSDGETYYRIVKDYDNGKSLSAEEFFRVNTQDGSVYIYFDPALPMSDYLAQFKSETDENDPQSRYIQIYGITS
ncbi:MAG: hypothetical protein K2J11_02120 [Oscillospiraceae bacterium]|nr:hypothetical protein [Oscillospiraceae bacterium]